MGRSNSDDELPITLGIEEFAVTFQDTVRRLVVACGAYLLPGFRRVGYPLAIA